MSRVNSCETGLSSIGQSVRPPLRVSEPCDMSEGIRQDFTELRPVGAKNCRASPIAAVAADTSNNEFYPLAINFPVPSSLSPLNDSDGLCYLLVQVFLRTKRCRKFIVNHRHCPTTAVTGFPRRDGQVDSIFIPQFAHELDLELFVVDSSCARTLHLRADHSA